LLAELGQKGPAYWHPRPRYLDGQLSWSPDGKWVAASGVRLLSAATGEQVVLTSAPAWLPDVNPSFSPDGRILAFVRRESVRAHDIFLVPRTGGEPARLTRDGREIFGLAWTAGGREIVFSSNRGGEPALWKVPAAGGTPTPMAETGQPASLPSLSPLTGRLAFTRQFSDTNIWRVDVPVPGSASIAPAKVIASTRTDGGPQLSPDGSRIAFTSDRSGAFEVWLCDPDGSNPVQLTSAGGGLGSWSPDGTHLAFGSNAPGDIYVVPARGGALRRLTSETSTDAAPNWSADGRWVYLWSDRTGRPEVWKVPSAGGPAIQVTRNGGHRPAASPDGKFVYYHKSPTVYDAWRVPVEGGEEVPVVEGLRSRWTVARDGLYLFEQEQDQRWFLKFVDLSTGHKKSLAALGGVPVLSQGPSLTREGRTAFYEQWDFGEADLMLAENFH
jgi:Tol biopolymer transport system component